MTGLKRVAAATVFTIGLAMPSAAFAADYTNPPPEVPPTPTPSVQAQTFSAPRDPGGTLPFTGADVAQMTLIGAGAVAVGVVTVRRGRRAAVRPA
jgi:hypothetical protein